MLKLLIRFVPVVCRGLALGFAVLAAAVLVGINDYATAFDRYLAAGLYATIAGASFASGVAVTPLLRRLANNE